MEKKGKIDFSLNFDNFTTNSLKSQLESFKQQEPKEILAYARQPVMKRVVPQYKDSNKLFEKYLYDIEMQEDPRIMVILANLYLEILFEKVLRFKLENYSAIKKHRHHVRMQILRAIGGINEDNYTDVMLVGEFRNQLAHRIKAKVTDFDFSKASSLKRFVIPEPFSKKEEREEYYKYILSLFLYQLIHRLSVEYKEIVSSLVVE